MPGRATLLLALLVGSLGGGCGKATVLNPSPGDALRAENQSLREQVDRLGLEVKELQTRVAEARKAGSSSGAVVGPRALAPEVDDAIPRLASVMIEGASDVIQRGSAPGPAATLRLWLLPRDGRGRFLQIVGTLTVGVSCVRAGESPVEVARATFAPGAVRDAWRSGFMGAHYAFEVPLELAAAVAECPLTVSIRFDDALTGVSFEDARRLAPPRAAVATVAPDRSAP